MNASNHSGLLLVVDDDYDVRSTLGEVLADEGYEVMTAAEGTEALRVLRQSDRKPALILLDLMMPGMNGADFRREQLEDAQLADIPVVIFSAGRDLRATTQAMGARGYVQKPVDIKRLIRIIEQFSKNENAST